MLQTLKNTISHTHGWKIFTLLLCMFFLLAVGIGTTIAYVVTGTPTLLNVFLNGMNPDGDLVIQKIISHPYGESYVVPEDLAFTFEVNMGTKYADKTVETSQGDVIADGAGVITVQVVPGGRTTIYDIDDGTAVTVTETNIGKGFAAEAAEQQILVQKHQENILNFLNTYTPEKADTNALTVSGTKSLIGREWLVGDTFTFDLSVFRDDEWCSLGTQTILYEMEEQPDSAGTGQMVLMPKPDFNRFDFSEMLRAFAFDKAGTYTFCVSEVAGSIGGLTYDKTEATFDVVVGDADMDGYLEIQSVSSASANAVVENNSVSIAFENKYAPTGSTEAFITIEKNLEDTSGQDKLPAGYTFELYDTENNLISSSNPTDALGQTSIRLVYEPSAAGQTFTYILREKGAGQTIGALHYDETEYKLQISIVDNLDGTVSAFVYEWTQPAEETEIQTPEFVIPENATNIFKTDFTNTYDPTDAQAALSGKKILTGRAMKDGEFTFCLYETDELFIIPENAQPVDTAANTAENGTFAFDILNYDRVGIYHYVVFEDDSKALGGVTYDTSRYLVTVTVTDTDGVLSAQTDITDCCGETAEMIFKNSYQATSASLPLKGNKILNGAELKDYIFTFGLYVADEAFVPAENAFQTVQNDENGAFAFQELIFEQAGTYRYVIREEVTEEIKGMTYDDMLYEVAVTVADPGDGQLVIEDVVITANGESVSDILFENTYTESDEPTDPDDPTDPDKPADPDDPSDSDNPTQPDDGPAPGDTGDDRSMLLWMIIMFMSGTCAALTMMIRYRRRVGR